jgi:hypothetical protein
MFGNCCWAFSQETCSALLCEGMILHVHIFSYSNHRLGFFQCREDVVKPRYVDTLLRPMILIRNTLAAISATNITSDYVSDMKNFLRAPRALHNEAGKRLRTRVKKMLELIEWSKRHNSKTAISSDVHSYLGIL